ncbi:MAG TPA: hypothetical protein VFV50_09260 [Bdellovibrionales bacterium]|nr:hypothetical protein [Bdellovibrionales bacterium]
MKKLLLALAILGSVSTAQADRERGAVIGVGTTSMHPSRLYERGLEAAVFETRACSISGRFSNGSRCYVVYDTGWSEYVNGNNRPLLRAFLRGLERRAGLRP